MVDTIEETICRDERAVLSESLHGSGASRYTTDQPCFTRASRWRRGEAEVHPALQYAMSEIRQGTRSAPELVLLDPAPVVDPIIDLVLMLPVVLHESVRREKALELLRRAQELLRLVDFWSNCPSEVAALRADIRHRLLNSKGFFQVIGGM